MTETDCRIVLNFPRDSAWITIPSLAAIPLRPVTAISRVTMRMTIHTGILSRGINMIMVAITRILSARGSRNFPSSVTAP